MATIVDERAPFRGRRITTVSLAVLAVLIGVGLGMWQRESATDRTTGVERAEELSPEAVRVKNTTGLFVAEVFSPEAVRIRNTAGQLQTEALSPEAIRMTNLADAHHGEAFSPEVVRMRNWESFILDSE